jgi:hypothetical protein
VRLGGYGLRDSVPTRLDLVASTSRSRAYETPSGDGTVELYVRRTPSGDSPAAVYDELKRQYDRQHPQYTLLVRDKPRTGVVALSGFVNHHRRAFYVRVVVGRSLSYYMSWRYPGTRAALADREITHMADTFFPRRTQH